MVAIYCYIGTQLKKNVAETKITISSPLVHQIVKVRQHFKAEICTFLLQQKLDQSEHKQKSYNDFAEERGLFPGFYDFH